MPVFSNCLDIESSVRHQQQQRNHGSNHSLSEFELDEFARVYGWTKLQVKTSANVHMVSYRRNDCRLNFWLTTGTCGSYLEHPTQKKTQLFRRKVTTEEAELIFINPRVHTNKGYHETTQIKSENLNESNDMIQGQKRTRDNTNEQYEENEYVRPIKKRKVSCRFGAFCTRENCVFEHRCRYGVNCNRDGCRYDHTAGDDSWWYGQECRLGFKCIYGMNCKFQHSNGVIENTIPCKYGNHCLRPNCYFAH